MSQLTGACLRGALRYSTSAEPVISGVCHCRDCQRFTGSAFAALVAVPKEALAITGTMKTFTSPGGSGKPVLRHFCSECGSSVTVESGSAPGRVVLNIGMLDDPAVGYAETRDILRRRVALSTNDRRHAALCQTPGLKRRSTSERRSRRMTHGG
jgi:hypothetical protein